MMAQHSSAMGRDLGARAFLGKGVLGGMIERQEMLLVGLIRYVGLPIVRFTVSCCQLLKILELPLKHALPL